MTTVENQNVLGAYEPIIDENGLNELGEREVVIAVMGITGAGKSYLINQITGQPVVVGDGLEGCTQHVLGVRFKYMGVNVTILDSPGFNDTYRTDTDVLSDISTYLTRTYSQGFKLSGIIYLHPISHARMEGSSLRNLRMFRKLVGDDALGNVVLATSHWSRVSNQEGDRRESDLRNTFWKELVSRGATLTRYSGNQKSGLALLNLLINKHRIVLDIQRELVDEGKELIDTAAGVVVNEELLRLQKKYEEDMKKVKEEMDEAMRDRDEKAQEELAEVKKELESQIAFMRRERDKIKEQGRIAVRDQQQIQSQVQMLQMSLQKQQAEHKKSQKEHEERQKAWEKERNDLRTDISRQSSASAADVLPAISSIASTVANTFIMWLNSRH